MCSTSNIVQGPLNGIFMRLKLTSSFLLSNRISENKRLYACLLAHNRTYQVELCHSNLQHINQYYKVIGCLSVCLFISLQPISSGTAGPAKLLESSGEAASLYYIATRCLYVCNMHVPNISPPERLDRFG